MQFDYIAVQLNGVLRCLLPVWVSHISSVRDARKKLDLKTCLWWRKKTKPSIKRKFRAWHAAESPSFRAKSHNSPSEMVVTGHSQKLAPPERKLWWVEPSFRVSDCCFSSICSMPNNILAALRVLGMEKKRKKKWLTSLGDAGFITSV